MENWPVLDLSVLALSLDFAIICSDQKQPSTMASNDAASSSDNSDISSRVLPHLDRHLALPVLQFLEEQDVYPKAELLQAKYDLLRPTNMVHYVESLRLELEGKTEKSDSSNAQRTEQRAQQIIEKRDELRAKADSVIEIISNPQVAESLGQDKERNLATLKEKYNVSS